MPFTPRRTNEDPADQAARLLSRLGVFLLFVVAQLAPILARQTVYILLPIGAVLLMLAASLASDEERGAPAPLRALAASPLMLAILFLIAWAGLSLLWTPFSGGPIERFAKNGGTLALVAVACAVLPARTKTSNLNLLPIGVGAAAVTLAGFAIYTRHPLTALEIFEVGGLQRAGLGLALLMWPAMGALAVRDRWYTALALAIACVAACILSQAPHVRAALVAGGAVFALCFGRPRAVAPWLAGGVALLVFLAPLAALAAHLLFGVQGPALLRPLAVWGRILASDGARALIGHGFGSALYALYGGYLDVRTPLGLLFRVWFELGIIGAAALAAVGARVVLLTGGVRPALAPFLMSGVVVGLVISVLGAGAEQLWWFTLVGLDVIAYALVMWGQFRKRRPPVPLGFGLGRSEAAGKT